MKHHLQIIRKFFPDYVLFSWREVLLVYPVRLLGRLTTRKPNSVSLHFYASSLSGQPSVPTDPLTSVSKVGSLLRLNNLVPMPQPTRRRAKTVEIKRIIRSLRGGSQARLVEGEDGRFYACKFAGNPQGNRTLVNEWVTQSILALLDISTPSLCVLKLPDRLRGETLYF